MNMPSIPDHEFSSRLQQTVELVEAAGLDALLIHSNEADFACVRYLSDYWPIFESAGVLVTAQGNAMLLIGPESETFARSRTKIADVRKLVAYREPAEPDYPSIKTDSFRSLFMEAVGFEPQRIGLAGSAIVPLPVYQGLTEAFPNAAIIKSDEIIYQQRAVKSANEINCLKEAYRITRFATDKVIRRVKPGMTELEIAGICQGLIYAGGAESEGLPQYVLSGESSSHAIGRPGYRRVQKGDLIQLNLSARVHGYSASIGVPVALGKPSPAKRKLLEFGLEAHRFARSLMMPGVPASEVAKQYDAWIKQRGFAEYQLYGPAHGIGMIEVERPWVESVSKYKFQPGMTFQVDTFFYTPAVSELARENGSAFGLRWENAVQITETDNVLLSPELTDLVVID